MKWLQRVWKFQTSEGHKALSWRSYVGFKKCRKDPTKKKMVEQKQWKREQRRKATLWHCNARMPTHTWAQSNQTKTVIEVLACAQTKNKLRPRQGKRLTDQVNLQSRDRSVFECFLTLLHREGKLCFCLLSRGSLKHKCCENEELGCWEVKANMCYKGHEWKMSGKWVIWFQFVETCWATGLATFFCVSLQCIHSLPDIQTKKKTAFCNQGRRCLHKRSIQSQKTQLMI